MDLPPFILKRLYIKGSLENVDDGFRFKIINKISDATCTAMKPIKVSGIEYPLDATLISSGGAEVHGSEISEANSFPIKAKIDIEIYVKGSQLPAGEHTIEIGLTTTQTGKITFDVTDTLE